MRRLLPALLVLTLAGCPSPPPPPVAAPAEGEPAGGEVVEAHPRGAEGELSELMAELLAPRLCDGLRDTFMGLPGEGGPDGPEAGRAPVVGRWWIRRCEARVEGGVLRVAIGGPGWSWIDRESNGFRVRQYLRFEGDASFGTSFRVGYDREARIASVWLEPAAGVAAQIVPRGLVQAQATGVFSSLLGGFLDLTGSSASDRARAQAASEGSERLREQLTAGFTLTYDLDAGQIDYVLGALPRGVAPVRPWPNGERPWLENERLRIWPGGLDVLGPLSPSLGEVALDLELEEGGPLVVRRVCDDVLDRFFEEALAGGRPSMPEGEDLHRIERVGEPRRLRIAPASCSATLLLLPAADSRGPTQLRQRLTPLEASALPVPLPAVVTQDAATPVRVQIVLERLVVADETPAGDAWDLLGGRADPYVVIASLGERRELGRSPTSDDQHEVTLNLGVPEPVGRAAFPLRFTVFDDDLTGDVVIGTAELRDLDRVGESLTLPLQAEGSTGGATGSVTVLLRAVD
jgi:hypothetical protein